MLLGTNGTGSTGNSYYIKANNGEILLLDAGLPIADIKKSIDYRVGDVVGCLVTHHHL
jgi:glyoxylase-like metal-dependent hydrolase (beta-lactamase superfamily II)